MFKKLFFIIIIAFSISGWASLDVLNDPQPGSVFLAEVHADRMENNSEVKERSKSNGNFKRIGRYPQGVLFAKTTPIGEFKGGLFIYNGKIVSLISEENVSNMLRPGDSLNSHKIIAQRIADGKRPLNSWEGEGGMEDIRQNIAKREEEVERERINSEKLAEENRRRQIYREKLDEERIDIERKRIIESRINQEKLDIESFNAKVRANEEDNARRIAQKAQQENQEKLDEKEKIRKKLEDENNLVIENNKKFGTTGVVLHLDNFDTECLEMLHGKGLGFGLCTKPGIDFNVRIKVRNNLKIEIKDIEVECKYLSQSGTDITPTRFIGYKVIVYEKWTPGEIRGVNFKIGGVQQTKDLNCKVIKWK